MCVFTQISHISKLFATYFADNNLQDGRKPKKLYVGEQRSLNLNFDDAKIYKISEKNTEKDGF